MALVDVEVRGHDLADRDMSPRVKLATRLYTTGACPTKQAAAEAAGLDPAYFSLISSPKNGSRKLKNFMQEVDDALTEQSVDMSKVLSILGRRAVRNIASLMEDAEGEGTRLRAAQDLADRSPETQKIQKHQVESFTISGEDAKELAAAMVESARIKDRYMSMAEGDFVTVDMGLGEPAKLEELPDGKQKDHPDEQDASVLEASDAHGGNPEAGRDAGEAADAEQELGRAGEGHGPERTERKVTHGFEERLAKLREIKARKAAENGAEAAEPSVKESYEEGVEKALGQLSIPGSRDG